MDRRNAPTETVVVLESSGPQLVATWHGGHVHQALPRSGRIVLGRGDEADIRIDHVAVSRRHATLVLDPPLRIEDHGSANGTMVAGARIAAGVLTPIPRGSPVQLGEVFVMIQDAAAPSPPEASGGIVVCDPGMQRVFQIVGVAAQSKLSVLLLGETGVGKEVLAARLHAQSPRADKPFLKVNCAALVEALLEAELFGHERGAFTGAVQSKVGLLEATDGGTLFLDEVGELPLPTQAKLLRVLESGEVTRVGGLKPRTVDVRFVSATNRHLREQVAAGRFREDLFFRLDGISIEIPPLRERPSEIVALASSLLERAAFEAGRGAPTISAAAAEALLVHRWPGNVRELRNVMQRSLLFCAGDVLEPGDLYFESVGPRPTPSQPPAGSSGQPPSGAMGARPVAADDAREAKRRRVIETLEQCGGNQTRAAELLGITRRTLQHWLIELDIPRPRAGGGRS
jgi:two-component system, NtrC family, response regulator AtoC